MRHTLITGAGRGLGLAFTRLALARGDHVTACPRSMDAPGGLSELSSERLAVLPIDLTKPDDIDRAAASVDRLDLLINSAGVSSGSYDEDFRKKAKLLESLDAEVLDFMFRVNALGPLMLTRALRERLVDGARVINISSQRASMILNTQGGNYGYCGTKAALNSFTRSLAVDLAPRDIVTVMIHPGWVRTDMGGPEAELAPEEAAGGILALGERLTMEENGRFLTWEGAPHPW